MKNLEPFKAHYKKLQRNRAMKMVTNEIIHYNNYLYYGNGHVFVKAYHQGTDSGEFVGKAYERMLAHYEPLGNHVITNIPLLEFYKLLTAFKPLKREFDKIKITFYNNGIVLKPIYHERDFGECRFHCNINNKSVQTVILNYQELLDTLILYRRFKTIMLLRLDIYDNEIGVKFSSGDINIILSKYKDSKRL